MGKLVKLLAVMPATNTEGELLFSAVCRIKTFLRSTMSQQCRNHLMLLQFIRTTLITEVANDFIVGNDHRKHFFGTEIKLLDLKQALYIHIYYLFNCHK